MQKTFVRERMYPPWHENHIKIELNGCPDGFSRLSHLSQMAYYRANIELPRCLANFMGNQRSEWTISCEIPCTRK